MVVKEAIGSKVYITQVNPIRLCLGVSVQNSAKPETRSAMYSDWGWHTLQPDFFSGVIEQEETQGYSECEVADEPVVVMKFRPVKAGNRLEDKTGTMASGGFASHNTSKVCDGCEGVK